MRKILSDLQLSRDAKSDLAIALRDLDNKGKEILYAFPHMATDITVERGLLPHKKAPGKGGHHLAPFYPSTHPSWKRYNGVICNRYA